MKVIFGSLLNFYASMFQQIFKFIVSLLERLVKKFADI